MASTGELQCRIVFHRLLHPYKNTIMETLETLVLFAFLADGLTPCYGSVFSGKVTEINFLLHLPRAVRQKREPARN